MRVLKIKTVFLKSVENWGEIKVSPISFEAI
jgi:hypothetical protein